MKFKMELEEKTRLVNQTIEEYLPKENQLPGEMTDAMRYSVLVGGKRVRPILMGECFRLFKGKGEEIKPYQAAMEFIHTASLVHDDLPAIDNDQLRRGKKTTHAQYGEALGVLAGDALLNFAYEVLISGIAKAPDKEKAIKAACIIAEKSGYLGMLGGQDVDVEIDKKGLKGDNLEILNYIYEKKTSALIEASMMAGAALAGAGEDELKKVEEIARKIGLAFQIQDDILDVTGTAQSIGKPVFSDIKNERETYVSLLGVEEASQRVQKLTKEAVALLNDLPGEKEFLKELLLELALRKK